MQVRSFCEKVKITIKEGRQQKQKYDNKDNSIFIMVLQ